MAIGMANWELDEDREGARQMVRTARDTWRDTPGMELEEQAAQAWLDAHSGG